MTDTKPKTPTHTVNGVHVAPTAAELATLAKLGVHAEPMHAPDLSGADLARQEQAMAKRAERDARKADTPTP